MSEPKKRGRPTNAEREAKATAGQVPVMNGDTSGQLERVEAEREVPPADDSGERAQAYAMRIWNGQSTELKRAERIERCERALIVQGLPIESVRYPGEGAADDWTEEDEQPVSWRAKLPKPEGIV